MLYLPCDFEAERQRESEAAREAACDLAVEHQRKSEAAIEAATQGDKSFVVGHPTLEVLCYRYVPHEPQRRVSPNGSDVRRSRFRTEQTTKKGD